jgi:hypothetical protein
MTTCCKHQHVVPAKAPKPCPPTVLNLLNSEERCDERSLFRQARIINTALTLLFS